MYQLYPKTLHAPFPCSLFYIYLQYRLMFYKTTQSQVIRVTPEVISLLTLAFKIANKNYVFMRPYLIARRAVVLVKLSFCNSCQPLYDVTSFSRSTLFLPGRVQLRTKLFLYFFCVCPGLH